MASKWRMVKHALGLNSRSDAPDHDSELLSDTSLLAQRSAADGEDDHISLNSPISTTRLLSKSSSTSSSQSPNTCSICLSALEPGEGHAIFTAECSHSFHFHCITSNVKHGNLMCPVCRANWKDIPFTSTVHHGVGGADPAVVYPPQTNAFPTSIHRLPPHPRRHVPTLTQVAESVVFDDDEPLGQPDHDEGTTSNLYAASSSAVKAIDIRTYTEVPSVQRNKSLDNFTVLIHLKAATNNVRNEELVPSVSQPSRTPVDLVTVLDISGSMSGSKIALLKRAVGFVIQNLSSNDRLSVVSFSSTARRLFPLLRMNESGRQKALEAVNSLMANGGTNIAEGLSKGAKVMEDRRVKNPVAGIILLSDGQDTYTRYANNVSGTTVLNYHLLLPVSFLGNDGSEPRIPVHTFGFGTDHDASLLHSISEMSGGTFSFIETESTIQDAFAQCIGGLLSVVVQELRAQVECIHPDTRLVTIKAGSYPTHVMGDQLSGYVDVGDLYAEEERDFLVSLNIPPETSGDSTLLLKVKCVYKDPVTKETVTLEGEEVKIGRPETVGEEVVSVEVDRQRNRLQAAEAMREARAAAEMGDLRIAASVLESSRETLASTASAKGQDQFCVALDNELKEMQERLTSRRVYEATGRAYILSGMSSHSSQRATARGDSVDRSSTGQTYYTSSMTEMVERSRKSSSRGSPAD